MKLKKIEGTKNTYTLELTESELNQEVWKYYKETKIAKYEVSNFGRFRKNNKIMNMTVNPSNGYLSCGAIKNNHRKVAEVFLEGFKNEHHINHRNGLKWDNRVDNLELVSMKENMEHAVEMCLLGQMKKVYCYRITGELVFQVNSITEACQISGLSHGTITKCINKKVVKGVYIFSHCKDVNFNEYLKVSYWGCKIAQLSLDGELLNVFKDEAEAYESVGNGSRNNGQIIRKLKTDGVAYGYFWILYDDYIYKKKNNIEIVINPFKKQTPIVQLSLEGEKIREFKSQEEALKFIGAKKGSSNILHALKGRYKTAFGYKWQYLDEYNLQNKI
ncbi:MAG: HNH endonuclease [Peptostreptococcaceae bacterium]|nr:HNH endonuclease [Peptostreptococcaceae bacterium]